MFNNSPFLFLPSWSYCLCAILLRSGMLVESPNVESIAMNYRKLNDAIERVQAHWDSINTNTNIPVNLSEAVTTRNKAASQVATTLLVETTMLLDALEPVLRDTKNLEQLLATFDSKGVSLAPSLVARSRAFIKK